MNIIFSGQQNKMTGIFIPPRLEKKLRDDQLLHGAVCLTLNSFESWLQNSHAPFFIEYTDHGPQHVSEVLVSIDAIIADDAHEVLSAPDAAVLILSTLLHDCALHLTDDGFLDLVYNDNHSKVIDKLGDLQWSNQWEEFLFEAARFDGRMLTRLFGETISITPPDSNSLKWTLKDRLLIGEFLRRHHHRLAHEVALFGVPGPSKLDDRLGLINVPHDIADLSGLVARSHGMPIRSVLDYLTQNYDVREYKRIHGPFLMALLRVADYLQIASPRAPKAMLKVRKLRSPFSQREWNAHHAIRDIRHTHEDPEALYIDAFPQDLETFLRIKEWLSGIQKELDTSWAILGEVYGRYVELNKLGLTLRRVRSNIDDVEVFSQTVKYVPIPAAFDSANPDLLKLMVGPLYGNKPQIGIRELIQNSVDAVRELRHIHELRPNLKDVEFQNLQADVQVSLEQDVNGHYSLIINDSGIGMTPEIIRDYFLRAGSSYRNSHAWRKHFENEAGNSQVLRSGRFGIGALAAFLLGPEMTVSTRHFEATPDRGITFKATLDSSSIEFRYQKRAVGTTIHIPVDHEAAHELLTNTESWDWYCLQTPKVIRSTVIKGASTVLKQTHQLPLYGEKLPSQWHRISHVDYNDIHWTYTDAPHLSCNEIIIRRSSINDNLNLWKHKKNYLGIRTPNISVFDSNGNLPLNLQRTDLAQNQYPFQAELLEDILRDFLTFILVKGPSKPFGPSFAEENWKKLNYKGLYWDSSIRPWLSTPKGICFLDEWNITNAKCKSLVLIPCFKSPIFSYRNEKDWPNGFESARVNQLFVDISESSNSWGISYWLRLAFRGYGYTHYSVKVEPIKNLKVMGRRVLVPRFAAEYANIKDLLKRMSKNGATVECEGQNCTLWSIGECPVSEIDFVNIVKTSPEHRWDYGNQMIAEWYLDEKTEAETIDLSPITQAWKTIINLPYIPYQEDDRKSSLKHAYEILESYIPHHIK